MGSLLLLFLLVTLGALISGLTGLGGGSLILAGLLMVYPPELAVPLHSFTQITSNALRTSIHFKTVNWRVVFFYACLMLPAAWPGAMFFDLMHPSWLKILVASFILFSLLPMKAKAKSVPSMRTFVFLGALSGFLGVFVGAVGPMVTPFFNRLQISRDGMLSTKSAGQALLQLSKIIAFSGAASVNFLDLKEHVGPLMLGSLSGVLISIPLSRKISDEKFNLIMNVLLALIALKILFEGVSDIW